MFRATQCSSSGESTVSIHHLVYITLCRWPSGMQVSDLHTRRPPTQSDIYQMKYWYNWFSWWWALCCSKHVEKWNTFKKCVKLVVNTNSSTNSPCLIEPAGSPTLHKGPPLEPIVNQATLMRAVPSYFLKIHFNVVRFEVPRTVSLNITVLLDVESCELTDRYKLFEWNCYPRLQIIEVAPLYFFR